MDVRFDPPECCVGSDYMLWPPGGVAVVAGLAVDAVESCGGRGNVEPGRQRCSRAPVSSHCYVSTSNKITDFRIYMPL